ncbi:hypothetical protein FHW88_005417 [Mucilaginibacter sp. SG538B]|nr:hypothetical protein [Mucilaginibacter sp. SG538B]SCW88300.1 hypothetical protein SAMN03159284_05363 [Mucilaginibacter sp. NFR10]
MIIKALGYTLKIWLTSIVISPILHLFINGITEPNMGYAKIGVTSSVYFILMSIPFGIILSIPSFLLLWLAVYLLIRFDVKTNQARGLLSVIGTALSSLAFYIVFGYDDPSSYKETVLWALPYCIVIVASVWYYRFVNESK